MDVDSRSFGILNKRPANLLMSDWRMGIEMEGGGGWM